MSAAAEVVGAAAAAAAHLFGGREGEGAQQAVLFVAGAADQIVGHEGTAREVGHGGAAHDKAGQAFVALAAVHVGDGVGGGDAAAAGEDVLAVTGADGAPHAGIADGGVERRGGADAVVLEIGAVARGVEVVGIAAGREDGEDEGE